MCSCRIVRARYAMLCNPINSSLTTALHLRSNRETDVIEVPILCRKLVNEICTMGVSWNSLLGGTWNMFTYIAGIGGSTILLLHIFSTFIAIGVMVA